MNCREIEEMQIIERYLKEQLNPEEAAAFEEHYFECDACFAELKLRDSVARGLLSEEAAENESRDTSPSVYPWKWALAAAAAVLILMVPVLWLIYDGITSSPPSQQASSQPSVELLVELSQIQEMPPYLPTTIRGNGVNAAQELFTQGMEKYSEEDYRAAAAILEEAAAVRAEHIPTSFYLGVSYLAINLPGKAIGQLERVADRAEDAYQEEALWYLAKAHFRLGNIDQGRTRLEQVAAMDGLFAEDARRNLKLLEKVSLKE